MDGDRDKREVLQYLQDNAEKLREEMQDNAEKLREEMQDNAEKLREEMQDLREEFYTSFSEADRRFSKQLDDYARRMDHHAVEFNKGFSELQESVDRIDRMMRILLSRSEGGSSDSSEDATQLSSSFQSIWFLKEAIGSGSFAKVYKGVHRITGAFCAIKVLHNPQNQNHCEQFEKEIQMLSKLKHKNIVQYYGSENINGELRIYLEYVRPGSIKNYQNESGVITELIVRNFTRHILSGLAYLHSEGIMHRDIKGDNILVDATDIKCVAKLADFGLAKLVTGTENSAKGTPEYAAPEVVKKKVCGFAADIWSLGCTIIEIFTGKKPWGDKEYVNILFLLFKDEHPQIPPHMSADGCNFLNLCQGRIYSAAGPDPGF